VSTSAAPPAATAGRSRETARGVVPAVDHQPVTAGRAYRVLLVDDDPVALLTWDRVLCRAGMAVTTAAGSEEALSLVAAGDFDVVVTDIQMPGLSGLELLDRLLRGIPDLPVVVVTSAVGVDSTLDVLRSRAAGFLRKPLDHADLVRTVTLLAQIRGNPDARSVGDWQESTSHPMPGPPSAAAQCEVAAAQCEVAVAECEVAAAQWEVPWSRRGGRPHPPRTRSGAGHQPGLQLQLDLEQGQRLEGLSQLAGGVAHDINNLLSDIVSHLDLVQDEVGAERAETGATRWEPVQADIAHIRTTLDRAAGLARHLLAFARREPAAAASEPQPLISPVPTLVSPVPTLVSPMPTLFSPMPTLMPPTPSSPPAGPRARSTPAPGADAPTPATRAATVGGSDGRGATVLVVDAEPGLCDATSRLLVRAGYRVLTAGSGPDALAVAAQHPTPVDLLLTDMNMPTMAGSEVASRFRALHPGAGVVVMSGYAEHADDPGGRPRELVLGKPFTRAALLDAVSAALRHH